MKKQTGFAASRLSAFLRVSCTTALLLTLGACQSNGSGSSSGSDGGKGNGGSSSSGSGSDNGGGNISGTNGSPDNGTGGGVSTPVIRFLAADDGVNGIELWKTDGTPAGTVLVKDINIAAGMSSNPFGFTEFNGAFYFQANDGIYGQELWKTDGTADGTVPVNDINTATADASSSPYGFIAFNGALYFGADDGVHGYGLWKTDGSAVGTVLVKEIHGNTGAFSGPVGFTIFKGALYFRGNDGVAGYELWKTDGTTVGTVLVKDINNNTAPEESSWPSGFTEFNGALYFSANDGFKGNELWKTDGTPVGTVLVKDFDTWAHPRATPSTSIPSGFTVFNGALYFSADDGVNGYELWKTDGTTAGTVLVKDINSAAGGNSWPSDLTVFNGALYFTTRDGVHGYEFWKTDGTADGTQLLKDICPGSCDGPMSYSGLG